MLFSLLLTNPILFLVAGIGLVISITIHEFAHAWVADRLGDPTPRYQGRITLNPLAHLDPLGTVALLLVGFGWGKPVQFDPYNLKNPLQDAAKIALAGPASNILLALVLSFFISLTQTSSVIDAVLQAILYINIVLAVFNLVPIHPLDGGKILIAVLPRETALEFDSFMHRYGNVLLLLLIVPWMGGRSPISTLISPVIQVVTQFVLNIW